MNSLLVFLPSIILIGILFLLISKFTPNKNRSIRRQFEKESKALEMFRKSFEFVNTGKYDAAIPLAKSGKEYIQKHLGSFNLNEQMLADFDIFFQNICKSKEVKLPQDLYKVIEEYINIVTPKLGDDTAKNLAMYIYLFHLDLFLSSWSEVLKPYRTGQ